MEPQEPCAATGQNQVLDSQRQSQAGSSELSTWQLNCDRPRFRMAEPVMVLTVGDDVYFDLGVVVGLEWCPPCTCIPGWWYSIKFTHGPSQGLQEQVPEGDLTLLAIRPPRRF
jgi:hypothetical protein